MPFLEYKIIKRFYNKLVEKYEKDYESFFKYFEKQWLIKKKIGKYIPEWNFCGNLKNEEYYVKILFLTNNVAESINRLLNFSFKYKYPNFKEWNFSILKVLSDFEKKEKELIRCNTTSKLMIYYIKNFKLNNKNINLLREKEIKELQTLNNDNIASRKSISEELGIKIKDDEVISEDEEKSEENDDEDLDNNLSNVIDNFESLNLEDKNELNYFLIQNIKDINIDKLKDYLNKELIKK